MKSDTILANDPRLALKFSNGFTARCGASTGRRVMDGVLNFLGSHDDRVDMPCGGQLVEEPPQLVIVQLQSLKAHRKSERLNADSLQTQVTGESFISGQMIA